MSAITARVISTSFALVCFAGTIFLGLFNGNQAFAVLGYALAVGVISWLIGVVLSAVLMRAVNEHIYRHMESNPIPDEHAEINDNADSPQAAAG